MNKVGNSQDRREARGGQATAGPWASASEPVQQAPADDDHPFIVLTETKFSRLTPGHPESTHCQERFLNPPVLYAA
jgi:hypothetical protein